MKLQKKTRRKLPRKIKKQVPKGMYCYTGLKYDWKTHIYHIRPCPFYTHIMLKEKPLAIQDEIDKKYPNEWTGWCKFLQYEIDDQCKSCRIKKHF